MFSSSPIYLARATERIQEEATSCGFKGSTCGIRGVAERQPSMDAALRTECGYQLILMIVRGAEQGLV